jgi:hypothetical protein
LAIYMKGRREHPSETGSSSYRLLFCLRLFSTPPLGDAVTSLYKGYDSLP